MSALMRAAWLGFRGDERQTFPEFAPYLVTRSDAALAARRGVVVVTTLGGISSVDPKGADSVVRHRADSLFRRNLRTLRDARLRLAVGSDAYRDDSSNEVQYLATLGVFDNLSLVRLWSEATPRAAGEVIQFGCGRSDRGASLAW